MPKLSTREKILEAAKELFAAHGFAGTSVGKIAKLAQVNHSLIFHHFASKENLWIAVKQSIARDSQNSKTLPSLNQPFEDFLQQLLQQSFHFYRNHPELARMLNWQHLEQTQQHSIGVTLSPETQEWIEAFEHYQHRGEINRELKPEFIVMAILSLISSAALDDYIFIQSEREEQAYLEFCLQLLKKALV